MEIKNYKGAKKIVEVTGLPLSQFNPDTIMKSGQVFRMNKSVKDDVYHVVSDNRYLTFNRVGEDSWVFDCPLSDFNTYWMKYFDLKTDYSQYRVDSDDSFLVQAAEFSQGMRILKQDLWETMVTFIISQQNNIPKIRKSVEALCEKFGSLKTKKIQRSWKTGELHENHLDIKFYAFPTPHQIAVLTLENLCDGTFLGYRGKYILKLAQDITKLRIDLQLLERKLSTAQQEEYLKRINGIGPKVSNCIMLYGLHKLESYPIDVWIQRVIDEEYPQKSLEEYLQYINSMYKGYQGYIQQIQFYYKRNKPQK